MRGGRHSFWAEWQLRRRAHPSVSWEAPAIRDNSPLLKAAHCNTTLAEGDVNIPLSSECKFNGGQVWNDPSLESFGENALNSFATPVGVIEG